jgi:hypothetical protein
MSKSLFNSSGCGGCCSSKSLINSSEVSTTTTITQFISNQNQGGGGGGSSTGVSSVVDNLTVNNNLTVGGSAFINNTTTNNLTVTNNFKASNINSDSNILLNPNNPIPCSGEVLIQDNLQVDGCYTKLCTINTYIGDPVPTLNYCGNVIPPNDNNDVGLLMYYRVPATSVLNKGFFGLDRNRYTTSGPRFAIWHDTIQPIPTNKDYRRNNYTNSTGLDIDAIYTYVIKNPDDPNAPVTIDASYSKNDINIVSSNDIYIKPNNDLIVNDLTQLHSNKLWEKHIIGISSSINAGFRVEDNNNACNFIELSNIGAFSGTGESATNSLGAGLYLSHDKNISIYACNGYVNIGPKIRGLSSSTGIINDVEFEENVCINSPYRLLTNTINEKSSSLTIQTLGAGRDINLISVDNISTTSATSTTITTTNGNITLNANGSDNLVQIDPGIRFMTTITSNPSTTNPQKTIWYDSTSTPSNKTQNFKTNYQIDGATINYPFVVSKSENTTNTSNFTNNKLVMFYDDSGWSIEKTEISISGTNNLVGVSSITGNPSLTISSDTTISGILTSTNVNNNICANGLIFRRNGSLYCYEDDTTIANSNVSDDFKLLYLDAVSGKIKLFNQAPSSSGTNYLCVDNSGNVSWSAISGLTPTLQDAYDNSTSPATITVNSTTNDQITITHSGGYANQQIFEVIDNSNNPYFQINKTSANSGNIIIGDNSAPKLDMDVVINNGTLEINNINTSGSDALEIFSNAGLSILKIKTEPTDSPIMYLRPSDNNIGSLALQIVDSASNSILSVDPNQTGSGKHVTINGNLDVTGAIDPNGINIQGMSSYPVTFPTQVSDDVYLWGTENSGAIPTNYSVNTLFMRKGISVSDYPLITGPTPDASNKINKISKFDTTTGESVTYSDVTITGTNNNIISYGNSVGKIQMSNIDTDLTVDPDIETLFYNPTLTANRTITLPTPVDGQKMYIIIDPTFGGNTIDILSTTPAVTGISVRTTYTIIGANSTWYLVSTQI